MGYLAVRRADRKARELLRGFQSRFVEDLHLRNEDIPTVGRRVAALLKLSETAVDRARGGLVAKDLVRYRVLLYQVLALPHRPLGPGVGAVTLPPRPRSPVHGPRSVGDVLGDVL